jgi:hypothetical protein
MEPIGALILIGAFICGFLIAGRWVENIFLQLLLGAVMGVGVVIALICTLAGVLFAGCLIMAHR